MFTGSAMMTEDNDFSDNFALSQYKQGTQGSGFGNGVYSAHVLSPNARDAQKSIYGNQSTQYKQQTDFQKKFAQNSDTFSESDENPNKYAPIRVRPLGLQPHEYDDFEKINNLNPKDQLYYFENIYDPKDPDTFDMKELANDPCVRIEKYKNSVYFGQFWDNKRHGKGVMLYKDGRLYEGQWENDQKSGKGYEEFPNGSTYEGEYANGKPDGIGTYTYYNGEQYDGDWQNGLKHGNGIWRGKKNDSYVGEWKYGKPDGYGVHTWVNGDRYEGSFMQGFKHGEGTEKFVNGDLYQGNYASGKPDGYGEYFWANGSFFKGYFKNGLREGHGTWKRSVGDSDTYEGQYVNDKKSGYGQFSWASGNEYKGHYIDDQRHGYGEMNWADGSYYKGMWDQGIQHGEGEMCQPGELPKKGLFENNIFVGGNGTSQMIRQNSIGPDSTSGKRRTNSNWYPSSATSPSPSYSRMSASRTINRDDDNRGTLPSINQRSSPMYPKGNNPLQRQRSTSGNYQNDPQDTYASNNFYDSPAKKNKSNLDSSRMMGSGFSNESPSPFRRQGTYAGASKITHTRPTDGGSNSMLGSRNNSLRRSGYDMDEDEMKRSLRANQKYNAAISSQSTRFAATQHL